jgi:hypothetical protein
MADMQLLLPPLEDGSNDGASRSGDGRSTPNGSSDGHLGASDSRSLLTPKLRESFETMKSIWRHSRRPNSTGNESFDGDDADSFKRKQRELAVETALAVNSEITRLQSGIAELEALLNVPQHHDYDDDDDEDDDDGVDEDSLSVENSDAGDEPQDYHPIDNPAVPVVLPLVIPIDDDNDDVSADRERDESAAEEVDFFRGEEEASIASSAPATPMAEGGAGAGN